MFSKLTSFRPPDNLLPLLRMCLLGGGRVRGTWRPSLLFPIQLSSLLHCYS